MLYQSRQITDLIDSPRNISSNFLKSGGTTIAEARRFGLDSISMLRAKSVRKTLPP